MNGHTFLNFRHGQSWRCLRKNFQECPFHCVVHVGVDALDLPRVVNIFKLDFFTASQHVNSPSRTLACCEEPRNFVGPFARQTPTMTAIRIIFRSQSPEWMAATCHGVFSHMMAPTHITPENPDHNQSARRTAPFQSLPPRRAIRRATTKVMTRVRIISPSTFPIDGVVPAVEPGSTASHTLPNNSGL